LTLRLGQQLNYLVNVLFTTVVLQTR
jgi:hypothetical protein